MYRNIDSPRLATHSESSLLTRLRDLAGDTTVTETSVGSFKFILVGLVKFILLVYIHHGSPNYEIEYLIYHGLSRYGKSINKLFATMEPHFTTLIALMGEFNKETDRNPELLKDI